MPSSCAAACVRSSVAAPLIGAAVDHRHGQRPAGVGDRDRSAARQRAVGDADDRARQRLAAGGVVAVEAGPVPGGDDGVEHRHAPGGRRAQRARRGHGRLRRERRARDAQRELARAARRPGDREGAAGVPRSRSRSSSTRARPREPAATRCVRPPTAASRSTSTFWPRISVAGAIAIAPAVDCRSGRGHGSRRAGRRRWLRRRRRRPRPRAARASRRRCRAGTSRWLSVRARSTRTVFTVAYGVSCRARALCATAVLRPIRPRGDSPHRVPRPPRADARRLGVGGARV